MIKRKKTDTIIIHCAATKSSMDIGASEIREWHTKERGFDDIGYHYVIRRNGVKEVGRDIDLQGAHAVKVNGHSIGICLVGGMAEDNGPENNFTLEQYLTLKDLIVELKSKYPIEDIAGHYEVEEKKPNCPGFHVKDWLRKEGI
jgi:N-acetylmuramoyl-L-alanine amidase